MSDLGLLKYISVVLVPYAAMSMNDEPSDSRCTIVLTVRCQIAETTEL